MKRALIATVIVTLLALATASLYAANDQPEARLSLGSGPINEQQLREKMAATGFTNIQITTGTIFETVGVKDGRSVSFAVDAQSGRVFERPGANDDDDD